MTQFVTSGTIGKKVSFTSKSITDPTSWVGVVRGVVDYDTARRFGDVLSYNAAVQQADSTVGTAEHHTYFIINLDVPSEGSPATQIFSNEWVDTFSIIDDVEVFTIDVYDIPSLGRDHIINVLKSAGFDATPKLS